MKGCVHSRVLTPQTCAICLGHPAAGRPEALRPVEPEELEPEVAALSVRKLPAGNPLAKAHREVRSASKTTVGNREGLSSTRRARKPSQANGASESVGEEQSKPPRDAPERAPATVALDVQTSPLGVSAILRVGGTVDLLDLSILPAEEVGLVSLDLAEMVHIWRRVEKAVERARGARRKP